jgi:thioredoxin 1
MKKLLLLLFAAIVMLAACSEGGKQKDTAEDFIPPSASKAKVTFIELGSVNCIPCKAMQPVMRDLEKKFGNQILVVF